ncbi:paramyosin, short form-like [Haematobia irritans]|uniref:paramyosin, short form-like n=1 Tax=Haematobia irritans TaxID=7368 RepID=UPI003F4F4A9C
MSLTYSLRTPHVRHMRCESYHDLDTPGYAVNFHQPVLDYLDAKSQHLHGAPSHTPWTDEIGPRHYRSTTTLNQHNAVKALKVEHDIDDRTENLISDLHLKHRAPFDELPIYDPSHVTRHTHPDKISDQAQKRIRYLNQRQLENQIKQDTMQIIERINKLELDSNALPREVERQVRGIYSRVLPPTEPTQVEIFDAIAERTTTRAPSRLRSATPEAPQRTPYAPYMQLIDERRASKLIKQVTSSLKESKRVLRKMDGRVECDFYKCSLNDRCWLCRKLMRTNSRLHYHH